MIEEIITNNILDPKGENVKYIALDLITGSYNPITLVKLAVEKKIEQQLGFLASLALDAARHKGIDTKSLDYIVSSIKIATDAEWVHLDKYCPEWGKEIIKDKKPSISQKKYKVYSTLTKEELADWIDLYITRENATTPRRKDA